MPSNHLILCHPLLFLPPIPPSIRVFSNESTLHMRWPNYWTFSFSISPSNEHPGLISFRMHWLDLLAVQGTLKSLLQHHSSKASIFRHSAIFTVQLSHPYMTTGKTIALTRWTFVGKVMSLLFYMLPRLIITFLPRSKHLLISWLQSPSAVILEPRKIKSDTVSTVSPSISQEAMQPDAMILVFWTLSFFFFFLISWRLITLQYCSGFCHTLTWISHGFTCVPILIPPSTSPSTWSLSVFPVHQVQAFVSCIQPGLVICFTLDNIHVSMLFSWNIPPSPSPTESKSLFYTSVSLFLFCI